MRIEERGALMKTVPDRYELLGVDLDNENEKIHASYVCDCDACGDPIYKGDEVIGIVTPSGEKLIIHDGEYSDLEEILDMIGVYYTTGDVEDVEELVRDHAA